MPVPSVPFWAYALLQAAGSSLYTLHHTRGSHFAPQSSSFPSRHAHGGGDGEADGGAVHVAQQYGLYSGSLQRLPPLYVSNDSQSTAPKSKWKPSFSFAITSASFESTQSFCRAHEAQHFPGTVDVPAP